MARGDFLSGLSKGIFNELNNQEQLQAQKDFQSKQGLVQLLTGLADKVEPESLPLLMGHIWDTMGIKRQAGGKGLRGFLDAFSGMPNRSVEDQLGSKFRELTKGMVGPQEAKDTRLRNNIAQKGIPGLVNAAPDSAYGQNAAKAAQDLKGKMVFRDPYQQKLDEIEARYGSQLQNQLYMQQQRNDAAAHLKELEYQNRSRLDQEKYDRQTNLGIDQVAKLYMGKPEIQSLNVWERWPAAREMARQSLSGERELKLEEFRSKQALRTKMGNKLESDARNGSPSLNFQERKFAYSQRKDRNKMQSEHDEAKTTLDTLNSQVEDAGKALDDFGKTFLGGINREQLVKSKYAAMPAIAEQVQKYNKAVRDRDAAKGKLDTMRKEMDDYDAQEYGKPKAVRPTMPSGKRGVGHTPSGVAPALGTSGSTNMVRPPNLSNPTGGGTYDATTSTKSNTDQNTYKIRADRTNAASWKSGQIVNPSYLKGNWRVDEDVEENGVKYRVIRRVP